MNHDRKYFLPYQYKWISDGRPLMYQGISNQFLGPADDVPLPSEADGIDFEGEFGVIVDRVPFRLQIRHSVGVAVDKPALAGRFI